VPEQVGGAHEGVARDLGAQQQLGLLAGDIGVRQQAVGGARQVVEDMFDMAEHLLRGGVAARLHFPFDLPVHDRQAAHYRHHTDHQRQQGAPTEDAAVFGCKGHAGWLR